MNAIHEIKTAVIGSGVMGCGIALACALSGRAVVLHDQNAAALDAAFERMRMDLQRLAARGRLTQEQAAAAMARISGDSRIEGVAACDPVIEAVFEDLAVKSELFRQIGGIVAPDALVASNTSALSIEALSGSIAQPSRFTGMHFFIPAHQNALVEITRGTRTSQSSLERAIAFCRSIGKTTLQCKDSPGFVVNRFYLPFINEAARIVDEGLASASLVDEAAKLAFEPPIAPLALCNLGSPRTTHGAIAALAALGPFYAPAANVVSHAAAMTPWPLGDKSAAPASVPQAIVDRLRGSVFLSILHALDQGVAAAADFDLAARVALRFGLAPVALMDRLGAAEVRRLVHPLCEAHGQPLPAALRAVGGLSATTERETP
ncbi:3-hydroxyacyl-CoA dehydrogenase family protein [Caenimonas soli]|uniref:3-hydroxyacyl-CoA dehydrogenase family protein n=1 Tax=Caenimonas soli TaxID=2735555 RepID=UPI001557AFE3|nr:3-hydroxyacyl-CoA dehydrogenase family protein [Caenimonas soli]NPC55628.1 3-hydroxyacyl-CoA dehydrogenase family protein [Caenimonas soli]